MHAHSGLVVIRLLISLDTGSVVLTAPFWLDSVGLVPEWGQLPPRRQWEVLLRHL